MDASKLSLDGAAKMKVPSRVKIANEITFLHDNLSKGMRKEYVSTISGIRLGQDDITRAGIGPLPGVCSMRWGDKRRVFS